MTFCKKFLFISCLTSTTFPLLVPARRRQTDLQTDLQEKGFFQSSFPDDLALHFLGEDGGGPFVEPGMDPFDGEVVLEESDAGGVPMINIEGGGGNIFGGGSGLSLFGGLLGSPGGLGPVVVADDGPKNKKGGLVLRKDGKKTSSGGGPPMASQIIQQLFRPTNVFGLPGFFPPQLGKMNKRAENQHKLGGDNDKKRLGKDDKKQPSSSSSLDVGDLLGQFPMHQSFVFMDSSGHGVTQIEIKGGSPFSDKADGDSALKHFLSPPPFLSSSINDDIVNRGPDPMLSAMMSLLMHDTSDLFSELHRHQSKAFSNIDPCTKDVSRLCGHTSERLHCLGRRHAVDGKSISSACRDSLIKSVPFACGLEIETLGCPHAYNDGNNSNNTFLSCLTDAVEREDESFRRDNYMRSSNVRDMKISAPCREAVVALSDTVKKFRTSKMATLVNKETREVYPVRSLRQETNEEDMRWIIQMEIFFFVFGVFLLLALLGVVGRFYPKKTLPKQLISAGKADKTKYGAVIL